LMFTGIIAAVGEVRSCEAIGAGRDMRLVIGVPGGRAGAAGVMRGGGLVFLPPVASAAGGGEGVHDCVDALRVGLEAEGLGLGALVRVGVSVVEPAGMAALLATLPGAPEDGVRRALAEALPGGVVPAVVYVSRLADGGMVQVEAVARDGAADGGGGGAGGGFLAGVALGASIACSGCCLTVVAFGEDWFAVEASAETLSLTTLGRWEAGTRVNLERALRMGDELGGHMVSGHVDGLGEMVARAAENGSVRMEFAVPGRLARFVAEKGSIAVDGVSLTVNSVRDGGANEGGGGAVFGVNVIPHTAGATTLGLRRPGEAVHIEVDGVARNAARLADPAWADPAWARPGAGDQGAADGRGAGGTSAGTGA
ncbi:MAG: riboflavin synthase, partial [Janthinobacterium lividum]